MIFQIAGKVQDKNFLFSLNARNVATAKSELERWIAVGQEDFNFTDAEGDFHYQVTNGFGLVSWVRIFHAPIPYVSEAANPPPPVFAVSTQESLNMYDGWAKRAIKDDVHAQMCESLKDLFPEQYYHINTTSGVSVSFKFKSIDEMMKVLRYLRANGYRLNRKKIEDKPADQRREYELNLGEGERYDGDIKLYAHFVEGGTCQYVQVDSEHKPATLLPAREVPVYELRCDGDAVVEEEAAV